MEEISIQAGQIRIPKEAREALRRGDEVMVTRHGRPVMAFITPEAYQLIKPTLERRRMFIPVPVSELLNEEDFAVMNMRTNQQD